MDFSHKMASERSIKVNLRGLALSKKNNGFKTSKAGSKAKPSNTVLFEAVMPEPTRPRKVSLNKEQAKSLLIEKRAAYLTGKLSCRPPVVKSSIKKLVESISIHLKEQA